MRRRPLFWFVAAAAAVAAGAQAWALRWTCDDAYLSFRYAQHFVEGHGLVFNLDPAEPPVEGYTNFSWTMLLALGMALGCTGDRIEVWAAAWGTLFHAGTVLMLAASAWRARRGTALVPIAACGWAVLHHAASLAPAGLETAQFTCLGVAMLLLAVERRCPRDAWLLGFLGVLAAMTRPDGALFCAAAGWIVLCDAWQRQRAADLVGFLVPFAVTFVPYLLWRRAYYGYWVPNTFYAKSGADPYPSQGFVYLLEYAKCYWLLVPAALVLLFLPLRRATLYDAVDPWAGRRPGLILLLFTLPYVAFVVWVGGDFMFARFLLPVTPFVLLALDVALAARPRAAAAVAVALVAGLILRREPEWLGEYSNPHGFSDNRAISVKDLVPGVPATEAMRAAGHYLGRVAEGLDLRLGIVGSHANLAFRARVPVAIECAAGLTDATIAQQPVRQRGVVGHERRVSSGYLEKRGVDVMLDLDFRTGSVIDALRPIHFPSQPVPIPARLVTYDRAVLRELKRRDPGIAFADFEAWLDGYLAELPGKPKDEVERDYAAFRSFYFDHNDDRARQDRFTAFLAGEK
jgi:hypothetical protein